MVSFPTDPAITDRPTRVVILGAAGRDFHDFNMLYRDDPRVSVVAFTAAQIPGISDRRYPAELAGRLYPEGIPIRPEAELEALCRRHAVDQVVFAYSDVPHATVMHLGSRALAAGASFVLPSALRTMVVSARPVIAITAVRTGCGKSPIARWVAARARASGHRVAVIRHPMPYGDLVAARVQRFASRTDLDAAHCTIEEREEFEPHIAQGGLVFAGVDYQAVLAAAEAEADLLIWDGGNNDFSFIRPDLQITVADALRPDQADTHHPGEAVARMADVLVINKVATAPPGDVEGLTARLRAINPRAPILRGDLPVRLDDAANLRGRRVLVIEDGPTVTHGGMPYGAGHVAALDAGAVIVDPRPYAAPALQAVFAANPHLGPVLPAFGYSQAHVAALADTIAAAPVDFVVSATPIDLAVLIASTKPVIRARYEFVEDPSAPLAPIIDGFLARIAGRA